MTKVYVLKTKDGEYVDGRGFKNFRHTSEVITNVTCDVDKAKQYSKKGIAKGVVTTQMGYRERTLDYYTKILEINKDAPPSHITRAIKKINNSIELVNSLEVVEVEVAKPNYGKPKRELKFSGSGGFSTKKSQANLYCKCCGMYFIDVPIMIFGWNKPARLCPFCILEYAKDAEKLIEEMGEERRSEVEVERFAHRLG